MLNQFDLLFYKGDGLISRIVRRLSGSKYSHVSVYLGNGRVVEIDWKYKLSIKDCEYNDSNVDVYRYKRDIDGYQKYFMFKFLYNSINTKYDFIEVLDLLIYKFLGIKLRDDCDKYICSSWVNCLFKEGEITLCEDELLFPDDLISNKLIPISVTKEDFYFAK